MNDFFDSLKDIKSQMVKEQKAAAPAPKKAKRNPNRDEFRDIFKDEDSNLSSESYVELGESADAKEARLKDEFSAFIAHAGVRKI